MCIRDSTKVVPLYMLAYLLRMPETLTLVNHNMSCHWLICTSNSDYTVPRTNTKFYPTFLQLTDCAATFEHCPKSHFVTSIVPSLCLFIIFISFVLPSQPSMTDCCVYVLTLKDCIFSEDILWFKPVELRTKWGRHGNIKEPLGTSPTDACRL